MALQDRIVRKDADGATNEIAPIVFYSSFYLWVTGQVQASVLQARFSLDSGEVTQAQALKAVYDGFGTQAEKAMYLQKVEATLIAYENLVIDKAELASILGL